MHSHVPSPALEQFRVLPLADLAFPDAMTATLFHQVDPQILVQVEKFGLLQPLPVQQDTEHSCHLLAGYGYLPVLHRLGYAEVVCQVLTGLNDFSRSVLQIGHCLSTVQTDPILQANLLRRASQTLAKEELMQLLPLMGYKAQQYKVQELLALLDLSPAAILALHHGFLIPKTGKLLSRISHKDQDDLVGIIERYRPGGSKQHKLVEALIELSLRHNQSIAALIAPWMESTQKDDSTNPPQQLQGLLRFLQSQSVPHLLEAEKQFQRFLQEFDLPAHVQLLHATSFEDESVELRIRCESLANFQELWQSLSPLLPPHKKDGDPG